jgi:peptidoglycan/xylan/chitin deacetylase (PgdA/CDA1 family)
VPRDGARLVALTFDLCERADQISAYDAAVVWTQQEYAALRRIVAERATKAGVGGGEIEQIPALPAAFRFPYGVCSPQSLRMTARLGLAAIQWDVISGDATPGTTAPQIVRTVLAGVKPGSIVVFHANGRSHGTAEALPAIVRGLRAKGYRFVTVSELLRAGDPVATDDCYELRPGDNRRYDRLFGEGTG